ncbi:MAG: response regulator [Lentisphaerae bacterium]|nr:response regulator [Lentisphaerota bacterium]
MQGKLLIVDDEEEIRSALSRHFRFKGYSVLTAGNGAEALAVMASNKIDVVISDIVMPIMDGVDLLRALRNDYPMVRTIMITGYVTQENVLACIRHDAETCVFKPWQDLSELETAVTSAMDRMKNWRRKLKYLLDIKPGYN